MNSNTETTASWTVKGFFLGVVYASVELVVMLMQLAANLLCIAARLLLPLAYLGVLGLWVYNERYNRLPQDLHLGWAALAAIFVTAGLSAHFFANRQVAKEGMLLTRHSKEAGNLRFIGFNIGLLSLALFQVGHFDLGIKIASGALIGTLVGAALLVGYLSPSWGLTVNSQPSMQTVKASVASDTEVGKEDYATPVHAVQPKINFSAIYGMRSVKEKLLEPAQLIIAERTARPGAENPANGILLHGGPGNGKTVFAEALAGELKVPFVQLTYGDVSSKWVGEMPRLISNVFAYAKRCAPCVLFVDEFDSFVRSRDMGGSNEESLKITNTLLTEIVNLRDHRVVLVAATNYLVNLDAAAIREGRFDYKVEITPPDEEARIGLLKTAAGKHLAHLSVDGQALESVAQRWNGFSVSRLLAVAKVMPRYAKEKGLKEIGFDEWMAALREVQGRNGRVPANTKSISELVLDASTREALSMIAGRLTDAHRIESLGGTLPSGVLFYGPPGTGKTAAARALAKQAGWAFLSVSGPDLVADREKLTKLYAEAQDIRPTLVFIDEGDDILRNRQYSSTPDLVNRLLVLMDGAEEKVKDVVFIAATNNPDQIDPALLRAGRFTEKVEFSAPPAEQIPRFVSSWLKGKKVMLSADLDAWEVAALLEGQTIANIEGVLQYALNRVIASASKGGQLVIGREDLEGAIRVVVPEGESS